MKIDEIEGVNDVFGVALCSGNREGAGLGLRKKDDETQWLPHENNMMNAINILDPSYAEISLYKNKWIHITLICEDDYIYVTFADENQDTIYVDNYRIKLRFDTASVNKLVFGRVYAGGNASASGTMSVKNIKIS